ncbi:RNA polymerase sigma factor [Rhodoferax sp.]|jgi:RNA polymerase sigma-70 factor (ECF subfamily)|uniref:RNA polymerase sigma factor n=1 Tax=Rhodoferax sp. TaxID=50421 RepID=UPI003783498E
MQARYQHMSDEQLMQAYCQGEAPAFDTLYARYEASLFRFMRRVLGQALAAQADEVFQDCWLRIVNKRASFSADAGKWKTWAFTIAHHVALDRLRTSGRELSVDGDNAQSGTERLEWLQATMQLSHASAEDAAFWRAAGKQLLQCLEGLPAVQRAVFLLHHEDGATLEELAKTLDLGFETVKSRLRYALQKLRGCMQGYLPGGEAV